jgi:hypothetical protein
VGSHIQVQESKDIGANALGGSRGDKPSFVVCEDSTHKRAGVTAEVGEGTMHNFCPGPDWAHVREDSSCWWTVLCCMSVFWNSKVIKSTVAEGKVGPSRSTVPCCSRRTGCL